MANYGEEAVDLARFNGALVINMGTVTPEGLKNHLQALKAYNQAGAPVLFDPVGGGATHVRRNAIRTLMAGGFFDVIKGNEGEIGAVIGETSKQQKGVDAGSSDTTPEARARLVKALAQRESKATFREANLDPLLMNHRKCGAYDRSHRLSQ